MIQPSNNSCLLYRLQKLQNSNFDGTSYTEEMQDIFHDYYQLPGLVRRFGANDKIVHTSTQPYDELFMWSLLLYSGKENDAILCRHFWSKTKYPIACALVAIIAYNNLLSENFVPEDLKEKLKNMIK
jgi:hypothetical protein